MKCATAPVLFLISLAVSPSNAKAQSCLGQLVPVRPALACPNLSPLCLCGPAGSSCHYEWVCPGGATRQPSTADPSIPLQYKPAVPLNDPVDTMRKIEENRLLLQQTELLRQQTEAIRKQAQAPFAAADPSAYGAIPVSDTGTGAGNQNTVSGNRYTGDFLNCRGWRELPEAVHLGYIMGATNGYVGGVISMAGATTPPAVDGAVSVIQEWAGKIFLSNGERMKGVDVFCSDIANSAVEIQWAIQVVSMRANGASAARIEVFTAGLRQQASDAVK